MDIGRRTLFQTAYYVTDIETAIYRWNKIYGAGPFVFVPHHPMDTMEYRGRSLSRDECPDLSYALGYLGDLMIQFTQQHDDRPSVYRDMYRAGEEGFHHIAYLTGDVDGECRRMAALGFAAGCRFTADGIKGAYIDTRSETGCFTEIHGDPPVLTDAFASWRRAHELFRPGDSLIIGD
jgi:hypothetical protein